jgi:hypothetical protein
VWRVHTSGADAVRPFPRLAVSSSSWRLCYNLLNIVEIVIGVERCGRGVSASGPFNLAVKCPELVKQR